MKNSLTLLTLCAVSFFALTSFGLLFPVMPHYAVLLGATVFQEGWC